MCPERNQRGFALVTAVFILVVLLALGAFIASISSQVQVGAALDVQGARAYAAARSGVEWGLYQVLKSTTNACSPSGGSVVLPGITGMTVTVRCAPIAATTYDEPGAGAFYDITAWACNSTATGTCPGNVAGLGYVERKIRVLTEKCATGAAPC